MRLRDRLIGATENPQLPPTKVVTPCIRKGFRIVACSGIGTIQSECECRSMKPGATIIPLASISRVEAVCADSPGSINAAIRPFLTATSDLKRRAPEPSITVPWRTIRSYSIGASLRLGVRGANHEGAKPPMGLRAAAPTYEIALFK